MTEYFCINCNEKMSEKCKLNSYPHEFMVFKCPECGYLNDWWALHDMGRGTLKSIIRALFLDSLLQGQEIMYEQIILYIKERYEYEKFTEKKIHCRECGALYYLMPIWDPIEEIKNIEHR